MRSLKRLVSVILTISILLSFSALNLYSAAEVTDEYVVTTVDAVDNLSTTVTVNLSEEVSYDSITDNVVMINTETGAEITLENVSLRSKSIVITLNSPLTEYTEYCVVLPEGIKTESGKTVYNSRVYFDVEYSVKIMPQIGNFLMNRDFSALDIGAASASDVWKQHIVTDNREGVSCAEEIQKDGNRGKVLKFEEPTEAAGDWKYLRLEGGDEANRWQDSADKDIIVFSFDYCRPEVKTTSIFNLICSKDGTKNLGQFYFDVFGNLVISNKESGSISIWEDSYVGGVNYPSDVIVYKAGMTANVWNTITIVVDKKNFKTSYYVDGNYAGTALFSAATQGTENFRGVRIDCSKPGQIHLFDNKQVGTPSKVAGKVVNFRMIDKKDKVYGPKESNVSVIMKQSIVKFSAPVNTSTVNADTLKITDGTEVVLWTNPQYDEKNNILTVDINGTLKKNTVYHVIANGIYDKKGNEIPVYDSDFSTTSVGELGIEVMEIHNASGKITDAGMINSNEDITLKLDVVNTMDPTNEGDTGIELKASITSYSEGVLSDTKVIEFDALFMQNTVKDITINSGDWTNGEVVAVVCDETGKPICDEIRFGGCEIEKDNWTMDFSETVTKKSDVYVEVTAPQGSYKDIIYRNQLTADDKGKFNAVFKLVDDENIINDAISGYYTFSWVDAYGVSGSRKVLFTNSNESDAAISSITAIVSASTEATKVQDIEDIADALDTNRYALEVDFKDYDSNDKTLMVQMLYEYIKANSSFDAGVVNRIVRIASVNAGTTENLFAYDNILKLNESRIKDFYKKYYVDEAMQKKITAKLKSVRYNNINDFYKALTEKFVLSVVESPDGLDNVKELIKAFSSEIGTGSSGTDAAYKAVMNNTYNSYDELKTAFNNSNVQAPVYTPSYGGGGGGGGSVKVSNAVSAPPQSVTYEQLHYDIFTDLADTQWAKDAIVYLAEKKIVSGKGDYLYCPNDLITRQEACKIIVLAFGYEPTITQTPQFNDVSGWAQEYVESAYNNGIVNGYNNGSFGAADTITRQDMAVMIYRAAINSGMEFTVDGMSGNFADESRISDYAREAIVNLYGAGYISGMGEGNFAPMQNANRAQIAQIIYNLIK